MKTVVVGDLHGKFEIVEEVLAKDCNVVFVGDYLDSFDRSSEDQVKTLELVLDACEQEPERVVGLIGNHEMSYLYPSMACSGFKVLTNTMVHHLKPRLLETLKFYHWVEDYLVTHAGVSKTLLESRNETLDEYLEGEVYGQIGRYRGGYDACGGLLWCDFNVEMVPPSNLKQVVGHTASNDMHLDTPGVRVMFGEASDDNLEMGEVWCVDNLDRKKEFIMIERAEAFPVSLDEI